MYLTAVRRTPTGDSVMLTVRKAEDRGQTRIGWLDSRHTFSFGDYFDPQHVQFRALRVINDDRVAGGGGFPTHPHRDMEIVTYVLDGALEHRDSLGHGGRIGPGEVQRMTAGTGILHSEFNPSPTEPAHFLQIWVVPDRRGHQPGYAQQAFPAAEKHNRWRRLVSRDGGDGALAWNQDAELWATVLDAGAMVRHDLRPGRHAWLQVARGSVTANGQELRPGDGAAVTGEAAITITAGEAAEVLLFDLA
jgi:redox-sensitive bicupin YhaK (pirin superfamily)